MTALVAILWLFGTGGLSDYSISATLMLYVAVAAVVTAIGIGTEQVTEWLSI
ncbi:hypothetical protein GCM10009039_22670 [Halocalculus aciditolerans]|uniref:Uncharacterized protein n=1 Tax=Halocalculus aciditolerans TaxID=1383812 RepID=A0A830FK30_9EURY|nr:hypothetical protein GCM10009039_22670 [Halocalculus aciditolerans]